jgi:hypothetical protein
MDNFPPSNRIDQATRALRISILLAAALLTAGGSIISQQSQSTRDLGRILQLVGYAIFAAVIAFLIAAHIRFWGMKQSLIPTSRRVCLRVPFDVPFFLKHQQLMLFMVGHLGSSCFWPVLGRSLYLRNSPGDL